MSMMCKMGSDCAEKKGPCGHEKLMIVMIIAISLLGHFVFHWF